MCHFGGLASEDFFFFFFCFGGWDVDLGDDVDERLGCAGEESVSDFVAVGPGTLWISKRGRRRMRWRRRDSPTRRFTNFLVVMNFVNQLYDSLVIVAILLRGLFCGQKDFSNPVIVTRSLSKSFSNNSGLLKLETEAEMDDGMQETCKHSDEHRLCTLVAREDILLEHMLPTLLVDFLPEKFEEIVIVLLYSEVAHERRGILETLDNCALGLSCGSLVAFVGVVASL